MRKELLKEYVDTIYNTERLEKDIKDYIARNSLLSVEDYLKFKDYFKKVIEDSIKPLLKDEVKRLLAVRSSAGSSSASSVGISGSGRIKRAKRKSKAKAKSKITNSIPLERAPTIPQTMAPTGLQPQQYRQPQVASTITPQLTQQLAQQVAEQIKQQQAMAQPAVAPATTGAGKLKKPRSKAKARLKPIKEGNEIVEVIKPPKMHLDYIDLNNTEKPIKNN